jgi:hypothetical protein
LRIARVDVAQRYGGQAHTGSWTARILARIGGAAVVAVLALNCLGLPVAQAAAVHRHADDPSPQAAPGPSTSTPAPDPAPQAAPRSTPTHTSTPSIRQTTSATSTTHPITVASSPVVPARTSAVPPVSSAVPSRAASARAHPASHHAVRHAPAARTTSTRVGRLSFPLVLPRDLLLLPRAALHAGVPGHKNGVLLLLSAVAMAVVAVASFTLLRTLRSLEAT